ncbi:acyl-CoA dehydrogenase family protein [Streptomyces sp. NRRL B-24085]|uniref:acyl-CoA dehydrogenase family protein n=1 Tax=Streptomyces sp. NRRL B-24085 TaxID=1709476 RepID=UPI0006B32CA8|nr:acyl-CoA dehydrogenase family protein [Streptomyces sp. NRRL B-24085]
MRSLDLARDTCERFHPGLIKALTEIPFADREAPGSPVIELLREHGGVGLLVPTDFGGLGADPVEAVQVQRALGSLSPSLAAAVTMHHFTVAMLYSLAAQPDRLTPAQLKVLSSVVSEQQLLASGWAEGRTQQNILAPSVTARPVDGGFRLSGSKKPCSLSRSMNLLTASIAVPGAGGEPELAVALVPVPTPGLSVRPFWGNDVLAAAESDEVRLDDVFVAEELVVRTSAEDPHRLDDLQTAGFVWFELLISAGYTGAAAALTAAVLESRRGSARERADVVVRTESAYHLIEAAARDVRDGLDGEEAVFRALTARFAAQTAMKDATGQALELLGGMDFVRSADHARLAASVQPLAFHPPSCTASAEALVQYTDGGHLELS